MENNNISHKPKVQDFTLDGVKHISVNDAYKAMQEGNFYFIDVRPENQGKQAYFEFQNVFNFPLHVLPEKSKIIPKDIYIICVCNSGLDSVKAVNYLNLHGFKNAYNLDGGIIEWKNQKLPIIETNYSRPINHSSCEGGCTGCS